MNNLSNIETFAISDTATADAYLLDLLTTRGICSVDEIERHANLHIIDPEIKAYFLKKGKECIEGK